MHTVSRQRLEFAAAGFLNEMRKQFAKDQPTAECPIKSLAEYSPAHRSALMAAVEKVIQFSGPDTDTAFAAWVQRREEQMTNNT